MVSNGEYLPNPQTDEQKQVERRILELSTAAAKRLGISSGPSWRAPAASRRPSSR
jgi:hypothetical protein